MRFTLPSLFRIHIPHTPIRTQVLVLRAPDPLVLDPQLARDRAAARSAKARAQRRLEIEAEQKRRYALQRQDSEQDLRDRINARLNRGSSTKRGRSVPVSRNAAVVIDDVFDQIDANGNGKISVSEMKQHIKELISEDIPELRADLFIQLYNEDKLGGMIRNLDTWIKNNFEHFKGYKN